MREKETTMVESKRTGVELRGSCSLSLHAVCVCGGGRGYDKSGVRRCEGDVCV